MASSFYPASTFRNTLWSLRCAGLQNIFDPRYDGYQEYTNRLLAKDIEGKQVLIIDNSYSGGTLTKMRDIVAKEGGIPSRLALFPKSKLSVQNSELALVLDTIIESETINTENPSWATDLYRSVLALRQPSFTSNGRVNSSDV